MAFNQHFHCHKCGFDGNVMVGAGNFAECPTCKKNEADAKRKAHFDALDRLTMEERVRKIEEWIYDYKPVYVRPPMF
jgi:hypothetical protein